jgi:hypothetical protein
MEKIMVSSAGAGLIGVARENSAPVVIRIVIRSIPRGASELLLLCPSCDRPRRMLFAWSKTGHHRVTRAPWPCRLCAGLRYASEGRYVPPWHRRLGPLPREVWYPHVHLHEDGRPHRQP